MIKSFCFISEYMMNDKVVIRDIIEENCKYSVYLLLKTEFTTLYFSL